MSTIHEMSVPYPSSTEGIRFDEATRSRNNQVTYGRNNQQKVITL